MNDEWISKVPARVRRPNSQNSRDTHHAHT